MNHERRPNGPRSMDHREFTLTGVLESNEAEQSAPWLTS